MESIYKSSVRILFITIVIIAVSIFSLEAKEKKDEKEKDCIYCKKYETMADWPESERPEAFIYEEIITKNQAKKCKTMYKNKSPENSF
jgi:hypothetical protein